jgi:hypothetical protein
MFAAPGVVFHNPPLMTVVPPLGIVDGVQEIEISVLSTNAPCTVFGINADKVMASIIDIVIKYGFFKLSASFYYSFSILLKGTNI